MKRPLSERYYSEDELVAIFDSAGDYYDDYLRVEALMLGARLYPESSDLMSRRAIYYSERDPNSFKNFLEDNPSLSTPLLDIMRLSDSYPDHDRSLAAVESFLEHGSLEEDEAVIQFVRMVHSLGLDKWLIDNMQRIRAKVSYMPTLLYEVAVTAEESPVLDTISVAMLEELTEIEPYCADYWSLLSYTYSRHNRPDDALQAIEYALAIDPDNIEALKAKLHTYPSESKSTEIDDILDRIHTLDPADAETAYLCVLRAEERGDTDKASALIAAMQPAVRATMSIAGKALELNHPDAEAILNDLYDYGAQDQDEWKGLAERAFLAGNHELVNTVMRVYQHKAGRSLNHDYLLFRILFMIGSYDLAVNMFVNAEPGGSLRRPENLYKCYGMYITMLLRSGHNDIAMQAAATMLQMLDTEGQLPGSSVERYGMRRFLEDVIKKLNHTRPVRWEKYDPLGLDEPVL